MRGAWIEIECNTTHNREDDCRSLCGECGLKYVEAVKRASQGMYRDGRGCISGVIPYLTAIAGRDAVQYSRKRDD